LSLLCLLRPRLHPQTRLLHLHLHLSWARCLICSTNCAPRTSRRKNEGP
jgi:hypothetical protein